jgi:hypothetical protein
LPSWGSQARAFIVQELLDIVKVKTVVKARKQGTQSCYIKRIQAATCHCAIGGIESEKKGGIESPWEIIELFPCGGGDTKTQKAIRRSLEQAI